MSGVLTRARLIPQERYDLEDLMVDQAAGRTDAKFWHKQFLSSSNYILKGFSVSGIGLKAATVAMTDATLINPAGSFDFSWFAAEASPSDIVVPDADLTDGVKNYLELKLVEETGTPVTKAFWDPAANGGLGAEFNQEIDTVTDIAVEVVVLTGGFSGSADRIKLAVVDVDGSGNITGILDKRDLYFRLKTDFSWATQEEPEQTLTLSGVAGTFTLGETITFSGGATAVVSLGGTTTIKARTFSNDSFTAGNTVTGGTSGATGTLLTYLESFVGADKDIGDFREMIASLMTEVKAMKGTDYWFTLSPSSITALVASIAASSLRSNQDRSMRVLDEVTWSWNLGTTTLSWDASLYIQVPALANNVNEISAGSISLPSDGSCAYVQVKRTAGASVLTVSAALVSALTITDNIKIIAQRVGSNVLLDSKFFALTDTGILKIREGLSVNKAVSVLDTTQSTTKDTGSLVLEGGLGVEKNLFAGGDVNAGGNLNVTGDTILTGNLTVNGTTTTINTATLDVEDAQITVNKNGNQATADSNDAGIRVEMTDATDVLLHYDSTATSRMKVGDEGTTSEIVTLAHTQTVLNKTATAMIMNGDTQLNDPMREEVASDNTTTGSSATIASLPSPIIRLTNASLVSLSALATPLQGKVITLVNDTGVTFTVLNNSGGSATERIMTGTGSNVTMVQDSAIILKYDSVVSRWRIIGGSGSGASSIGELDILGQGDAELGTTGWNSFKDAAGTLPVDGTGGSITGGHTFAQSSTLPLNGTYSFLLSKPASNTQGEGFSKDLTVPLGYPTRSFAWTGIYSTDVNYVDDDYLVYFYDQTGAVLVQPTPYLIKASAYGTLRAELQIPASCVAIRAIIFCATTSATTRAIKFDDMRISPVKRASGPISVYLGALTTTGSATTNTTYDFKYWRTAEGWLKAQGKINFAGAPNAFGALSVNIPAGMDIDLTRLPTLAGTFENFGMSRIRDASALNYVGQLSYTSTNLLRILYLDSSANLLNVTPTAPFTITTSDDVYVEYEVPITGWGSSATVSEDFGTRQIVAEVYKSAAAQTIAHNTLTTITWDTVRRDTAGIFDDANDQFVLPESGNYIVYGCVEYNVSTQTVQSARLNLLINGTDSKRCAGSVGAATEGTIAHELAFCVPLNGMVKGDTVRLQTFQRNTGSVTWDVNNNATGLVTFFGIAKLAGNQQIAASEIIFASYASDAGQSIPDAADTTINFEDKLFDTHNAVTVGVSWVFTAPVSGWYQLYARINYTARSWTAGDLVVLFVTKNGTNVRYLHNDEAQANNSQVKECKGQHTVYLLRGETMAVRTHQDNGANVAASLATDREVYIDIMKVGGVA